MAAHRGIEAFEEYPLLAAILHRRSRRISRGLKAVRAGHLSYESTQTPVPLSPLEEALLILVTGVTGFTMPDAPFETPDGQPLLGSPMIEVVGRAASSPDNAQATHFFLLNDAGTYFLRRPAGPADLLTQAGRLDPDQVLAAAEACKVRLGPRLDFARSYPAFLGRNAYTSNLPGTTILVPVLDLTRQYINGMMYLLSQKDGDRPTFIDDWNFYRLAGVKKWVRSGFLNADNKLPLGFLNTFRIHIEADLLIQNLLLTMQALGLGGWIHAAPPPQMLLGDPEYARYGPGLKFRFEKPKASLWRWLRKPITPLPAWRPNPVGLEPHFSGFCPPYYRDMNAAIDDLIARKYSNNDSVYHDLAAWEQVFRPGMAQTFLREVSHYTPEVIACAKDVCTYIYDTYGRFPAHVDAMWAPGVWVQAHHVDLEYYDRFFKAGNTDTQRKHFDLWHGKGGEV
jgi:hypothetical protein